MLVWQVRLAINVVIALGRAKIDKFMTLSDKKKWSLDNEGHHVL